jgi:hypothetical protein
MPWQITPCSTDSNNAHGGDDGATSNFLEPKAFYRSIQQQFQLLRAIFVITFGRGTHTGTVISVQDRPPPQRYQLLNMAIKAISDLMAIEQRLWYGVNLAPKSQWPFFLTQLKGTAEVFHANDCFF